LASLDAEIANLARDANLAELAQVEQKISALGSPGGDNDARRRMRSLLEGQRDLLRGLATQLEAAEQRRTHLTDLLRTLWLQVASLRAEAAHDALAETTASGKIRAACEEIGNYLDAAATVRFITTGKK
jgi:geranylgeranyl pyrophosphate synthase